MICDYAPFASFKDYYKYIIQSNNNAIINVLLMDCNFLLLVLCMCMLYNMYHVDVIFSVVPIIRLEIGTADYWGIL